MAHERSGVPPAFEVPPDSTPLEPAESNPIKHLFVSLATGDRMDLPQKRISLRKGTLSNEGVGRGEERAKITCPIG